MMSPEFPGATGIEEGIEKGFLSGVGNLAFSYSGGFQVTGTAFAQNVLDQTTTYVYGSSLSESEIARADLLRAVIYPDGDDTYTMTGTAPTLSDGDDATYDRVEYEYNRLGEVTRTKDQNETVHEYLFDLLGRQTTDKVTAFGTNIDQAVQRISRTYEVRGMVASITSHDDPDVGEGNVLDEVVREYNDFGQLESISAPAPLSPSLGFR